MKLDELKRLEKEATGGLWQHGIAGNCNVVYFNMDDIIGVTQCSETNAALIVAMRNNIRALIEVAEAAQSLVDNYGENPCTDIRTWKLLAGGDFRRNELCAALSKLEGGEG